MKKQAKKKKQKINNKKVIIASILLVILGTYLVYVVYLLIKQPTNVFTIEEGSLYQEETNVGYVIRDETVVRGENYKNGMEQIISEGERASVNENIFRYYSTNEESLKSKIAELDIEIQEAMEENTELSNSSDMKLLENQIDEQIESINQLTDITELEEKKKAIENLITKKAKIAGESSPQGSYLNQLIEERKQYESELNSGAEYVTAPRSGIVSYRVDGLEDVLTPDNLSSLSKEFLESLDLSTGKIVATSTEEGKVIDNFYCYIATITSSEEAKQAEVGDDVSVRLSNNAEVDAEITNIIEEDDGDRILILKLTEQVKELISYRKITFDLIWWDASGLKVPNQAIVSEGDLNYVVRNRAGYLSKILVKVVKQGENYSIIDSYTTEELRELGLTDEEIINYKSISLYDEILINPDLSKVE